MPGITALSASSLSEILKRLGAEQIESMDKEFNPEEHEAITQVEVDTKEHDNRVIEEFQKGYRVRNRILRPAKVKVGIYKNIKD